MNKKTVLLIDDEKGYAEGLQDALDYEGFRVLTATTAEEALSILRNERVDLATVDIMMPPGRSLESKVPSYMTGVILCRTIKKHYPHTQVICISVVTDRNIIDEIERQKIQFFRKGEVSLRAILNVISTKLRGRTFASPDD